MLISTWIFWLVSAVMMMVAVIMAAIKFGASAALIVGACIAAAAMIGAAVSTVTGGDLLDGLLLGASIAAVVGILASGVGGSKKKPDDD